MKIINPLQWEYRLDDGKEYDMADQYLEKKTRDVQAWPRHAGKADLLKHLRGEKITQRQAIGAKCYECAGGEGGVCTIRECPLLPFSPYASEAGDKSITENGSESPGS